MSYQYPKAKENANQITQLVFDEPTQALRITGDIDAQVVFPPDQEVEINAEDGDSVIAAGTTDGTLAGPVRAIRTLADGTVVTTTNITGGTFTEVSPSDFRATTPSATLTPTAVTFSGFTMVSVSLYAPPENTVSVRVGKSDVATNFFLLTPGSSVNLPLQATTTPVYYMLDSAGTAKVSILALGN
jgi:hypothetical protein